MRIRHVIPLSFVMCVVICVPAAYAAPTKAELFKALIMDAPRAESLIIGDEAVLGLPPMPDALAAGVPGSGVRTWTQYAPDVLKRIQPKHVLVVLGMHDRDMETADWEARYEALCDILSASGAAVVLSTILPAKDPDSVRRLNDVVAAVSARRVLGFVDSWKALSGPDGRLMSIYAKNGGLSDIGYARWASFLTDGL